MRTRFCLAWLLAAVGCSAGGGAPRSVPNTGGAGTYYVDSLQLPFGPSDFAELRKSKDAAPWDQLGNITAMVRSQNWQNRDIDALIGAHGLEATLEITADASPPTRVSSIRWNGTSDSPGDEVDAKLSSSKTTIVSNPMQPAAATLVLPLFDHAAPVRLTLDHWDMTLTSDGAFGWNAELHGTTSPSLFQAQASAALVRTMFAHPDNHTALGLFDTNHDGVVDASEIAANVLFSSYLSADETLAGEPVLTVGVGLHLVQCALADGQCVRPAPSTPSCTDGVRDGDEVDLDCGGGCEPCFPGDHCAADSDCQTGHCDGGRCRAQSCSDGVRDGFETDVDCGFACGGCAAGQRCDEDGDCASGSCNAARQCG